MQRCGVVQHCIGSRFLPGRRDENVAEIQEALWVYLLLVPALASARLGTSCACDQRLGIRSNGGRVSKSIGAASNEDFAGLSTTSPRVSAIFARPDRELFETASSNAFEMQVFDEFPCGAERIVLVDDDSSIRRATRQILEELGYEVEVYPNGSDALVAITRDPRPISLLVTDYNMPGLTGYELAQRVRAERPGIPILISSGSPVESIMPEADSSATLPFLPKPYTMKSLAHKIREILDVATAENFPVFTDSR